jgi:predicted DCC family thiol-disulfide oxidoreductase YuxK
MKPQLIYDGECQLCIKSVALLKSVSGDSIECRPSSDAAKDHPEIPLAAFKKAVQFIRANGTRVSAAEAILEALIPLHPAAKWIHSWYFRSLIIRFVLECGYEFVANHRQFFSDFIPTPDTTSALEQDKMQTDTVHDQ